MNFLTLAAAGGSHGMGDAIKDWIDALCSPNPTMIFVITIVAIAALVIFRKTMTKSWFGWGMLLAALAAMAWALQDPDFRRVTTLPDNIPIVGMIFLTGFFTWLAMRRSVENDDLMAQGKPNFEASESKQKVFVWPDLVYTELICMVILTVVLIVWSVVLEAPLEEPASPAKTPNPSKAPWYFVGLQEDLIYFDPWIAGVILPGFIIVGLMAIPYLDRNPKGNGYYTYNERKLAWWFFAIGFLLLWMVPIVIGTFLRGPNQAIFGPFEAWDPHKLPPIVNVDLSDIFWINLLGSVKPEQWYIRELPGILMLGAFFVVLPVVLAKTVLKKIALSLGPVRYGVLVFLFLSMALLPIKMVLRWTMNLKYFVAFPADWYFSI